MTEKPSLPSVPPIELDAEKRMSSLLRNIPQLTELEIKMMQDAQEGLASLMKLAEATAPALLKLAESMRVIGVHIAPLFKQDFLNQWVEAARKTVESVEYSKETLEEASTVLVNLGWWIYPDWDFRSLRNIINLHNEGKDKEIEASILGYFNEKKLDNMTDSWKSNPLLKSRTPVLEDAIWAHKQGKFTL